MREKSSDPGKRKAEKMKKHLGAILLIYVMAFILIVCTGALAEIGNAEDAPDYSRENCWLQLPEITKDIDTFFFILSFIIWG